MKKNARFALIFITFLVFLFNINSSAFAAVKKSDSENENQLVQHLEWKARGVVKEYKVVIEEKTKTGYSQVISRTTKETFCDVSLKPGQYRYTVYFYNVLGQMAFQTAYENFEILEAVEPKSTRFFVEFIYLMEDDFNGELKESVRNIDSSTKFYLVNSDKTEVKASSVRIEKRKVYLKFPKDKLTEGCHYIRIENNGGLSCKTLPILMWNTNPFSGNISLGLNPQFIMYDDFFPEYFNLSVLFQNLYLDANLMYDFNSWGRAGAGIVVRDALLGNKYTDSILLGNNFAFNINAVFSVRLPDVLNKKLYLDAYAGFGLNVLGDVHFIYTDGSFSEIQRSILPCFDAGLSARWLFKDRFFAKAGVEYYTTFDFGKCDYNIGAIDAILGVGVEL